MGYCGLKIPGHSETDFKHKKAFNSKSKLQKIETNFQYVKIESREQKQHHKFVKYYSIILVPLSICIIILLIGFSTYNIHKEIIQRDQEITNELVKIRNERLISKQEFLANLFEKAKDEYNYGEYTRAHEKLYAILLVQENNRSAENLLIKVLTAKCEKENIGCNQLEYYSEYLDQKYLS